MSGWIRAIYFCVFILQISCATRDGRVLEFQPQFGSLLVTSTNFFGARIFLDYHDTGKTTPARIGEVPIGRHVIHVFLSKHKASPDSMMVDVKEGKEETIDFELNKVASGDLKVTTIPDSAIVLVNKLRFGYSPITIFGLPLGDYSLSLLKGSYAPVHVRVGIQSNRLLHIQKNLSLKRLILLEHFSNTSCAPCPQADAIIEKVLTEMGAANVASLGYHPPYPSNNDPMYLASRGGNDDRVQYYDSPPLPHLIVDGSGLPFSSFIQLEADLRAKLNERTAIFPSFTALEIIDFSLENDFITGRVRITTLDDFADNFVLRIALIEREVSFDQPPGANGQTRFIDVFRGFFPAPEGISLALSADRKKVIPFQFERKPEWGRDLHVVAFLQNDQDRRILQAAWSVFP